jgi:hypothetical protein
MRETTTWIVIVAIVCLTTGVTVVHYNQTRYLLQLDCMGHDANWETRENSGEIGCRMQNWHR